MTRRLLIATSEPTHAGTNAGGSPSPRRISVVGSTGSGKTHLARELSEKLDLPHIELDSLRGGNRAQTGEDRDRFMHAIEDAISRDSWIIDGHYREVRHKIWQRADVVIHLDYPLVLIARQLLQRYLRKRSQKSTRVRLALSPDTAGHTSDAGMDAASWRRRLSRLPKTLAERREYARVLASPEYAGVNIQRFTSHKAAMEWIRSL